MTKIFIESTKGTSQYVAVHTFCTATDERGLDEAVRGLDSAPAPP